VPSRGSGPACGRRKKEPTHALGSLVRGSVRLSVMEEFVRASGPTSRARVAVT